MRLMLVTETFTPELNGVARTLERWVRAFRERSHHVRIVRPRQPLESAAACRVVGVPLPLYPELRFGVASRGRLLRLLRDARPDLVHIATEGPLGLAALWACQQLGLPVATSFHTNFDQYLEYYGLRWLRGATLGYLRWFHRQAAVTLVPGEGVRQRLLAAGFPRVELWTRGVDAERFHPRHADPALRRSLGLTADDVLLLYVGRLAAEKNLPALLDAYATLRRRLPRVRLALVGDGPLARRLAKRATPDIILPGVQTGQALARWYASADVFVFPSRSETFGNVVREAMASGLPVVGFDSVGVGEQVTHGETGLLVPPNGSLVEALHRLCISPALRARFGAIARHDAEAHAWEPIFDALEQRYALIVAESRAATSVDAAMCAAR